ncbi:MAG: glycosyltransferase family 39 protein [Elusimicrobia bacterium]|nr:glycosyltransferase family 39 protein [Elusimicrobiota bacterium]
MTADRETPRPCGPWTGLAALLLAVSGAVSVASLGRHSPGYDEICHVAAGYDLLRTGRIRFGAQHPPLGKALEALPLRLLDLHPPEGELVAADPDGFGAGWAFFFRNSQPPRRILLYSRVVPVLAGLGLGIVVFLWARRRFGELPAVAGLAFLLGEPMGRALAGMALLDMPQALFLTAALWRLHESPPGRGIDRRLVQAGALGAAAGLCKFSGLAFLPAAFLVLWIKEGFRPAARKSLVLAGIAACCFASVYAFSPGSLAAGMRRMAVLQREGPPAAFFMGTLGRPDWPYYYLVSFVIKTPFPFILAAALGAWALWSAGRRRELGALAAAGLVFFAAPSLGKFYATRYVFPVIPLGALAIAAGWNLPARTPARLARACLLAWLAAECVRAHPHYLSYMNWPWRQAGYRYLANSDLEWGQNLPDLAAFWERQGKPGLIVCHFGSAPLEAWGITAQEIPASRGIPIGTHVLPPARGKEYLAVSAGCRQFMTLTLPDGKAIRAWDWLERRTPAAVLAGTIYVYDVTGDPEAHGRVGQLHYFQGEYAKALREARRVLEIAPGDPSGRAFLSAALKRAGPGRGTKLPLLHP